jgi:hypothetical protein
LQAGSVHSLREKTSPKQATKGILTDSPDESSIQAQAGCGNGKDSRRSTGKGTAELPGTVKRLADGWSHDLDQDFTKGDDFSHH